MSTVISQPGQKLTVAFPRENGGVYLHQDGKGIVLSAEELRKLTDLAREHRPMAVSPAKARLGVLQRYPVTKS